MVLPLLVFPDDGDRYVVVLLLQVCRAVRVRYIHLPAPTTFACRCLLTYTYDLPLPFVVVVGALLFVDRYRDDVVVDTVTTYPLPDDPLLLRCCDGH